MSRLFPRFIIATACCLSAATAAGDDVPGDSQVTFWGGIEHWDFGETSDSFIEAWDHKLASAQLGFDAHVADTWLVGAAVSWSRDEHDTSQLRGEDVDLDSTLIGIHPYLVWSAPDGRRDWWVAVDYGKGDFDISTDFSPRLGASINQGTTKIGVSHSLLQRGETEWRLKGEVQHARVEVDDECNDGLCILPIKYDSNRLCVALEARQLHFSVGKIQLQPTVQAGVRYYGGNLSDGAAVEIDGVLRHRNLARGLTVEGRAWVLDGISGDENRAKEWDISATLRLARPSWRGLLFVLTSGYGSRTGDIHEIWRNGWWTRSLDRNPNAWFYARIVYGLTLHPVWTTCPRLQAGC